MAPLKEMVIIFTSREAAKADLRVLWLYLKNNNLLQKVRKKGRARGGVCDQCFLRYRDGTQGGIWEFVQLGQCPEDQDVRPAGDRRLG